VTQVLSIRVKEQNGARHLWRTRFEKPKQLVERRSQRSSRGDVLQDVSLPERQMNNALAI